MSEPDIKAAIRTTAQIAFGCAGRLTDAQMEAVLLTLVEAGANNEAAAASDVLALREQVRKAQMYLEGVIKTEGNS